MQNNYCIDVDYQLRLVRCTFVGPIKMREVIDARIKAFQIAISLEGHYNLLMDCRDADIDFRAGYFYKLWFFLEANKDMLQGKMEVILTNKPLACAYSILYKDECDKRNYGFKVRLFSTEEAALWWLEVHSVTNENR